MHLAFSHKALFERSFFFPGWDLGLVDNVKACPRRRWNCKEGGKRERSLRLGCQSEINVLGLPIYKGAPLSGLIFGCGPIPPRM